ACGQGLLHVEAEQRLRIGGKQLLAENSTKRFYPAALGKSFRHLSACRNDTTSPILSSSRV
ncbi:hypothetical protein, partial [Xanthomonas oryzae]|uniref:hypothetical protein n=1 Tax=Xanthomonas oryzae TaxID=347 RepID=UPI001C6E4D6D